MSKPTSKQLVTAGTEGTAPRKGAGLKPGRSANTAGTRKASRRSKTQPPPQDTKEVTASKYEPTSQEQALKTAYLRREASKPRVRGVKVTKDGATTRVCPDHADVSMGNLLLMQKIGSENFEFFDGLLAQLISAGCQGGEPDERTTNFMLSVVEGIAPKDQVEAMLGAQMAAVHLATMTFARRLNHVSNIAQQDSAERALNKLARTFTSQVEALKRYRTGGQQKVTVEHVTVNAGGQAIVGTVSHAPGEGREDTKEETTP